MSGREETERWLEVTLDVLGGRPGSDGPFRQFAEGYQQALDDVRRQLAARRHFKPEWGPDSPGYDEMGQ